MMRRKRTAAGVMAGVVLAMSILGGCGGEKPEEETKQANNEAKQKQSQASANDENRPDWMQPFDETVTLKVVVGWDADPSVKEGTTPESNSLIALAEDLFNIKLDFLWMVPNDQFDEKLALQLSSGDVPDILMLKSKDFYEFTDIGQLRDLTDAYHTYGSGELKKTIEGFGGEAKRYASRDGRLYGIPAVLDPAEGVPGLYYRADWLEAINMEPPANMEEVNDMLVKLAEYGKSVNGGKDVAGLGSTSSVFDTSFGLNAYFQCYGAYPGKWVMKDGSLINGMVQDEMLDGLKGLKDLYSRGGLAVDFATWNSDQFNEKVAGDQVAAAFGSYWIPAFPLNLNKDMNPDAEWNEIKLVGPEGKEAKPAMDQVSINHFNVVNKNAPKEAEEALVKLLNLSLMTNSNSMADKSIFEGKDLSENGAAVFYLPVYMYYVNPWEEWRKNIWEAYEKQDDLGLKTQTEKDWYGYMNDWLTNGNDSKTRGTSWGMYKSRLARDSGIAMGLDARKTGVYEPCYFYGAATPTERKVSSSLKDMTVTFAIDYIMGKKTDSEWEAFKKSWYDMGGDKWTEEANTQYNEIIGTN